MNLKDGAFTNIVRKQHDWYEMIHPNTPMDGRKKTFSACGFNKNEIKTSIITNLFRVVKNRKLFCYLRASLGVTPYSGEDGISSLYWNISLGCNNKSPLTLCHSINDLVLCIDNYISPPFIEEKNEVDAETNTQLYIVECLNFLLHSTIEYYLMGKNGNIIEEIGQEVFNKTCIKYFGEDFVDRTTSIMPQTPPKDLYVEKESEVSRILEQLNKIKAYYGGYGSDLYGNTFYDIESTAPYNPFTTIANNIIPNI